MERPSRQIWRLSRLRASRRVCDSPHDRGVAGGSALRWCLCRVCVCITFRSAAPPWLPRCRRRRERGDGTQGLRPSESSGDGQDTTTSCCCECVGRWAWWWKRRRHGGDDCESGAVLPFIRRVVGGAGGNAPGMMSAATTLFAQQRCCTRRNQCSRPSIVAVLDLCSVGGWSTRSPHGRPWTLGVPRWYPVGCFAFRALALLARNSKCRMGPAPQGLAIWKRTGHSTERGCVSLELSQFWEKPRAVELSEMEEASRPDASDEVRLPERHHCLSFDTFAVSGPRMVTSWRQIRRSGLVRALPARAGPTSSATQRSHLSLRQPCRPSCSTASGAALRLGSFSSCSRASDSFISRRSGPVNAMSIVKGRRQLRTGVVGPSRPRRGKLARFPP